MSPAGYQARITIVDPDPGWPAEARREAAAVAEAVGPETIRVEVDDRDARLVAGGAHGTEAS